MTGLALALRRRLAPRLTGDADEPKDWMTSNGAHIPLGKGGEPMGKTGKAIVEHGEGTTPEERQRKIDSVKIDFNKDNTLPGLNKETLDDLGKQDKPVLLKKSIIEKNKNSHPDISEGECAKIIGQSLYNPDGVFPGNSEKPYMNFVAHVGPDKNTVTLLDVTETKENFEIVNWRWSKDRQRKQIERRGEKIKGK